MTQKTFRSLAETLLSKLTGRSVDHRRHHYQKGNERRPEPRTSVTSEFEQEMQLISKIVVVTTSSGHMIKI